MLIKKPGDIPSSEITSKETYLNRRKFITGAVAAGAALAGGFYLREHVGSSDIVHAQGQKLTGVVKSPLSTSETPTSFKDITNYNNYYEFSTDKYEPNGLAKISARVRGPSPLTAWSRSPRSWILTRS